MTTAACRGFVYATAVMGVTGARTTTSDLAGPLVARTKATTDLPVGVGLGVSTGDQAAEVASYADGVIVGSAFVRALLDHADDPAAGLSALRALTEDLAGGVRRGVGPAVAVVGWPSCSLALLRGLRRRLGRRRGCSPARCSTRRSRWTAHAARRQRPGRRTAWSTTPTRR